VGLEEEAISEILVADMASELSVDASDVVDDYFEEVQQQQQQQQQKASAEFTIINTGQ
jgi:ABC-type lipoprotein release transport system permease subunit